MSAPAQAPGHTTSLVPKLEIKGFSLSSKTSSKTLSFPTKTRPPPPSTLGKRPRASLHQDSDGSDDERPVRHEIVTGFDGGNAITDEVRTKKALVIPKMKNRDWREDVKQGKKNLLPPEIQAQMEAQKTAKGTTGGKNIDVVNAPGDEPKWGLTITKRSSLDIEEEDVDASRQKSTTSVGEKLIDSRREKTEDERAIDALMGIEDERKGPDLIITATTSDQLGDRSISRVNEEDAYRKAVREAPDVPTFEDYERVPVEEFGAALLRGMGWKEGDTKKGRIDRPKEVKRRPNRLGLGAKELKEAEELGAWVQKPKGRNGDRRPKANEYRDKRDRERDSRDERYGSHRRDRDDHRQRGSDRDRRR